jgi:hypothetical protein
MDASGNVFNLISSRSPIFYDSDNTGYYVDPNSTSNLVGVVINGTFDIRDSNAQFWRSTNGAYQRVDTRTEDTSLSRAHWYGVSSAGATSNFRHAWYDGAAYFNVTAASSQVTFARTAGTTSVASTGDFRAPIFYDSDNTAFFINAATRSTLSNVTISSGATESGIRFRGDALDFVGRYSDYMSLYNAESTGEIKLFNSGFFNCNQYGVNEASWRAPIFYDSNNTGFYVDPAGTSQIANIRTGNVINIGGILGDASVAGANFHGIELHVEGNRDYYIGKPAGTWTQPLHIHFYTGIWYRAHISYGGHRFYDINDGGLKFSVSDGSNIVKSLVGFHAPIMYDTDNTGYYMDPTGTSSWVTSQQNGWHYFNGNYGHGVVGLYASTRFQCVYAMGDAYKGNADGTSLSGAYGLWWSYPSAGGPAASLGSHGLMCIVNGSMYAQLDLSTQAIGDMRTPIFYDRNDTGYYTDPNDLSRMNVVRANYYGRAAHNTGHLRGGYNNIGASEGQSSPIYTIGSSYEPSTTTLGNMYGIGFTASGSFFPSGASGWGLYVADNGNARIFLSGGNGEITATGNITAYASDRRLKTNITPISNALDKVMKIRGVEFDWVDNIEELGFQPQSMHETGVIAQEIQAVISDAVRIAPFNKMATDISGVDNEYLTVDKEKIVPLLIEAIKELKAEIEMLKAR